jgi:4-hydroxy-3-polyprenylbenzoate decarboxylase
MKILEERGQLKRISALVDPDMEIAEISNRMLRKGGPGLLFENVKGASFPVAVNLMGTVERICWAMNMEKPEELETLGKKLSMLQQPKPPKKISQAIDFGKVLFDVVKAKPGRDFFPPCQQVVVAGNDLDLNKLPLIRPYPGDAGKIITLGLVITKDCETGIPNVGV